MISVHCRTQFPLKDASLLTLDLAIDEAQANKVPLGARIKIESGFLICEWIAEYPKHG